MEQTEFFEEETTIGIIDHACDCLAGAPAPHYVIRMPLSHEHFAKIECLICDTFNGWHDRAQQKER